MYSNCRTLSFPRRRESHTTICRKKITARDHIRVRPRGGIEKYVSPTAIRP